MSAELASRFLERQHVQLDQGIQQMVDGDRDLHVLREALDLLRLHVWIEEEIFFEAVAGTGLAMPIYILEYEHAEMWSLLEPLDQACRSRESADHAMHKDARALYKIFQVHNPKEEDLIYPAIDRTVADDSSGALGRALRDAKVPDGWICRGKREDFAPPPGAPPWKPRRRRR